MKVYKNDILHMSKHNKNSITQNDDSSESNSDLENSSMKKGYNNKEETDIKAIVDIKEIVDIMREKDPSFDKQRFLTLAKNMFIKYKKNSYEKKNIHALNNGYMKNKFKNIKLSKKSQFKFNDFGGVKEIVLTSYKQTETSELLTTRIVYVEIKNEYNMNTGEKIKGLSNSKIDRNVFVVFERKFKEQDEQNSENNSRICKNCGAPVLVTTYGTCMYCGSIIRIKEAEWEIISVSENS